VAQGLAGNMVICALCTSRTFKNIFLQEIFRKAVPKNT